MSFILDALKKSDRERKRGEVPTLEAADREGEPDDDAPAKRLPWWVAGGFAAVAVVMAVVVLGRNPTPGTDMPAPAPAMAPAPQPEPAPAPVPEPAPTPVPEPEPVPAPASTPAKVAESQPVVKAEPRVVAETRIVPPAKPDGAPVPDPVPVANVQSAPPPKPLLTTPAPVPPEVSVAVTSLPVLNSAEAYLERGWQSLDRGLYNQAAADFTSALDLEPGFADALYARGWAKEKQGDDAAALADYSRTLFAKPDHTGALFSRGYLNLYGDDTQTAIRDFSSTLGIADPALKLYTYLWLYVARVQDGADATAALARETRGESLDPWPGALVRYFRGSDTDTQVIRAIEEGDADNLQARRCVGYFFLGKKALMNGNGPLARSYFEKTLSTGVVGFRQFDAARRELMRLNP